MLSQIDRVTSYIYDIDTAIEKINSFIKDMNLEMFMKDEKTQDAVHMRLLVIGESINNIQQKCPEILERYPQMPWRSIRGMRNKIAHDYFSIEPERTWAAATVDLPVLKKVFEKIKESEPEILESIKEINSESAKENSPIEVEKKQSKTSHRMR